MMQTLLRWQLACRVREYPGRMGLLAIALLPLLYLLPLQRAAIMFPAWEDGAETLAILLSIGLAAMLMRDSARVPPAAVWLFQKGLRIDDLLLLRWMIDLGLLLAVCVWSMLGVAVGSVLHGAFDAAWLLQLGVGSGIIALIAGVLLFGMAAAGSTRGGDVLVLLAFAGMLEPLLAMLLPATGRAITHALVLPLVEAASLANRVSADPTKALHSALHLTVWTAVWLAFGIARLRAWRPALGAPD